MAAYDLAATYRQLATLLAAGISPARSFDVLAQESAGAARRQFESVSQWMWQGNRISDAMAALPRLFPRTHCALVVEGETTGRIDTTLHRLADLAEYALALRRSLTGELWRPGLTLMVALPFVVVLLPLVAGPVVTAIAYVLIVLFLLLLLLAFQITQLPGRGRAWATQIAGRIPGLSMISSGLTHSYFTRSLAVLYAAGVPIAQAIRCAADSAGDAMLAQAATATIAGVLRGESVPTALERAGLFPPLMISMAQTGQATGDLDGMLTYAASYFEQEAQTRLHRFCIGLGAAGLVLVGIVVGIIVINFWRSYFGAFG